MRDKNLTEHTSVWKYGSSNNKSLWIFSLVYFHYPMLSAANCLSLWASYSNSWKKNSHWLFDWPVNQLPQGPVIKIMYT